MKTGGGKQVHVVLQTTTTALSAPFVYGAYHMCILQKSIIPGSKHTYKHTYKHTHTHTPPPRPQPSPQPSLASPPSLMPSLVVTLDSLDLPTGPPPRHPCKRKIITVHPQTTRHSTCEFSSITQSSTGCCCLATKQARRKHFYLSVQTTAIRPPTEPNPTQPPESPTHRQPQVRPHPSHNSHQYVNGTIRRGLVVASAIFYSRQTSQRKY